MLWAICGAAALAGLGWAALWARGALVLPADPSAPSPVLVDIPPGTELRAISLLLERRGVVRSAWAFELLARREGVGTALEAGTYALSAAMTPRTILGRLAHGDVAVVHVTVPEGASARQVVAALAGAGLGGGAALASEVDDGALLAGAGLPPPAAGVRTALEGFLFPATYAFPPDASARALFAGMLAEFQQQWTPALAGEASAHTGLDMVQTVTLASIVQREVAAPAQMPVVAGVYLNRLKAGMNLDADPTVLYALGLESQQGALTTAELSVRSPYNTYLHAGLPPGPICNPGAAALAAAANPAATAALYFITTPAGRLVLADTLSQQEANIRQYLGS